MGRPKAKTGEVATTTRLLEAALLEFAESGYEGAKLADIARQAGISRPSLLYHYGSKQALYGAAVQEVLREIGQVLAQALADSGSFEERLLAVVSAFVGFTRERPQAARVILREIMDDRGPGHHLILELGVPLIDGVERFIRTEGAPLIVPELPVRAALMQVISAAFVRAATGPLADPLWGEGDHSVRLARSIFFGGPPKPESPGSTS